MVQAKEGAEGHKPATSVVGEAVRVLLVDLTVAEANVRRAIGARKAAVLLPAAVGHPAVVEDRPVAAVGAAVVAAVVEVVAGVADVGEQV